MTPTQIKALRQRLGFTQERFAQVLGVSFVSVNRWERGKTIPSRLAIAALRKLKPKKKRSA